MQKPVEHDLTMSLGRFRGGCMPSPRDNRCMPSPRDTSASATDSLLSLTKVRPLTLPPVPACFLCPISQQIMEDPVTAADGVTYEREHIAALFEQGLHDSPTTHERLTSLQLQTNDQHKSALAGYLDLRRGVESQWQDLEADIHWYIQQAHTPGHWSLRGPSMSPARGTPRRPCEPQAAAIPLSSPRPARPAFSLRPLPVPEASFGGEGAQCPFQAGPAPRSTPRGEPGDERSGATGRPVALAGAMPQPGPAPRSARGQPSDERPGLADRLRAVTGGGAPQPAALKPRPSERSAFDSLKAVLTLTPRLGYMLGRSPASCGKQTPRMP